MFDKIENWLILVLCAVLLIMLMFYVWQSGKDAETIADLRVREVELQHKHQDMQQEIERLTTAQSANRGEITGLQSDIEALEWERDAALNKVAELEEQHAAERLDIRGLNSDDELEVAFVASYPEIANSRGTGIWLDEYKGLEVPMFTMPAYMIQTFLIEHDEALKCRGQLTEYQANEERHGTIMELVGQVDSLQAQNLVLEAKKTAECQAYVMECNREYRETNREYIDHLQKPRFDFGKGLAATGGFLAGAAVGVGVCAIR